MQGIVDEERQRDHRQPPPPEGLRRDAPVLGVARRCPRIDSSSRLQPRPVALATNIIGFMEGSTKLR